MKLLTRKEASDYLRVSFRSLDRLVEAGEIVQARITKRRVLFREDDLDRFLEKKFQESAQ